MRSPDLQTPPHHPLKVSVEGVILGSLLPPSLITDDVLPVSSSRTRIPFLVPWR